VELRGSRGLSGVELRSNETGKRETLECSAVFVFIGAVPYTGWLPDTILVDGDGFVETGPRVSGAGTWSLRRQPFFLETSEPGIFAAGDVRLGSIKRVASAVGEGAMAVHFVHQNLASR
jgi:thioredoxin reductase (NADPH)